MTPETIAGRMWVLVDTEGLERGSMREPQSAREKAFAAALRRIEQKDGPAPWPVFVLAAPDRRQRTGDEPALATTRRILLRETGTAEKRAAAIVINTDFWSANAPPSWSENGLATLVAKHELHHARRAWLRPAEAIAKADAIEERVRAVGSPPVDRRALVSLVEQGMAAQEEMEAIDRSIDAAVVLPAHRQGILRYREENRLRAAQVVKGMMNLFPTVRDGDLKTAIQQWLGELLSSRD